MINIGVLGGSSFAEKNMIPLILEMNHFFKLKGIASRSSYKADDLAKIFETKAFDKYENLLSSEDLDAIYIPLPNGLHFQWIEKALNNGLHVLVEKSLACSYDEVKQLNSLAKKKQLALIENFQFRFHSQLTFIKELVESGAIGELRSLKSSFGFPPFPDKNNIRYQKELGGGALFDAGAYPIKISQEFLGNDLTIRAAKLSIDEDLKIDLWGGGFIEQIKGDLFAETSFGFDNYYQCNIEVWGSKGKISTNRIFTAKADYNPVIYIETAEGTIEKLLPPDDAYKNMLQYFCNAITNPAIRDYEYIQNNNQARLLEEFRKRALTNTFI